MRVRVRVRVHVRVRVRVRGLTLTRPRALSTVVHDCLPGAHCQAAGSVVWMHSMLTDYHLLSGNSIFV